MRSLFISVATLAVLATPHAFAQSPQGTQSQQGSMSKGQAPHGSQASMQSLSPQTQKQVKDGLKQAGFQDVQILDAAYVVVAQSKDGDRFSMLVDSASGGSGSGGKSGGTSQQSSGQQSSDQQASGQQASVASQKQIRQQLSQAGFQSVQIVAASYVARATTKNGEPVFMTIDPAITADSTSAGSQSGGGQPSGTQTGSTQPSGEAQRSGSRTGSNQ